MYKTLFALAVLAVAPSLVKADVVDSAANGFTIKLTLNIQAHPDDVYREMIQVGDWWNSAHTFSGSSRNLSIEAKAMGCFCEKLPNQGSVRHMQVLTVMPGKMLVLSGALGPLQSLAATGTMTIQFSPAEGGTKLEVTYGVSGYLAAGMNTWAVPANAMLSEQFTRLKSYLETGRPQPSAPSGK